MSKRFSFAALFLSVAFGAAQLPAYTNCKTCLVLGNPSIPPGVMRMPMSAKILPEGLGRSGISMSYFAQEKLGQDPQYPLDREGRLTGYGMSTRWGLAEGVELGGTLDYPFLVPSLMLRIQPLGATWNYGPFLTLELGINAMPDFHAGGSVGFGFAKIVDLHGYYQLGKVLDRDYGEWGGGLTVFASPIVDIEFGLGIRTLWGEPITGDAARGSLSLVFGNRRDLVAPSRELIKAFGGDPYKAFDAGDFQSAADLFQRELKFSPDDGRLWDGYGRSLKALGHDSEAIRAFARARKFGFSGDEKKLPDEGTSRSLPEN